jgi:hypothetical protein
VSLNAHDRQALAQIAEALASTDPRFAATMSALSRLAVGGAMPERERISEPERPVMRPVLGLRPGQPGARRWTYWIAVAMAVAVTLAMISTALVRGSTGGSGACAQWEGLACVRQAAHSTPPAPSGRGARDPSLAPQPG